MTKTLTEQWREGTLPEGYYYVLYADQSDNYPSCDTEDYDDIDYWNGCEWHYDNDPVVEVLGPVPSYDEWKQAKENLDKNGTWYTELSYKLLEKKLEIALEVLGIIAMHSKDTVDAVQAACAISQIKEMEGVK